MGETVYVFGRLYTPWAVVENAGLRVRDGVVVGVEEGYRGPGEDYRDYAAAPAYIDTHIHGCCGFDALSACAQGLEGLSKRLAERGVAAYVLTTVTAPHGELLEALRCIGEAAGAGGGGAEVLGARLEGPYLSPEKRGAHDPRSLRLPSRRELEEYRRASRGRLLIVDVAPELPGALELISYARSVGVHVGIGHTNASYEEAWAAILAGADRATHIFNAMRGFHHRSPGPALALLEAETVYVEVIGDLVHLHPATIRLVHRLAGPRRTVLVSDAIAAAGLPDGAYRLGGLTVRVEGGVARLETGELAGSTKTLDETVRNLHYTVGLRLPEALAAASLAPAESLGLRGRGCLYPGCRADIVVLDEGLRVRATIIRGEPVYSSRGL